MESANASLKALLARIPKLPLTAPDDAVNSEKMAGVRHRIKVAQIAQPRSDQAYTRQIASQPDAGDSPPPGRAERQERRTIMALGMAGIALGWLILSAITDPAQAPRSELEARIQRIEALLAPMGDVELIADEPAPRDLTAALPSQPGETQDQAPKDQQVAADRSGTQEQAALSVTPGTMATTQDADPAREAPTQAQPGPEPTSKPASTAMSAPAPVPSIPIAPEASIRTAPSPAIKAVSKPDTGTAKKPDSKATPKPGAATASKRGTEAAAKPNAKTAQLSNNKTTQKPETKKAAPATAQKPDAKTAQLSNSKTTPKPETKQAAPATAQKPDAKIAAKPAAKPEPRPAAKPAPRKSSPPDQDSLF